MIGTQGPVLPPIASAAREAYAQYCACPEATVIKIIRNFKKAKSESTGKGKTIRKLKSGRQTFTRKQALMFLPQYHFNSGVVFLQKLFFFYITLGPRHALQPLSTPSTPIPRKQQRSGS